MKKKFLKLTLSILILFGLVHSVLAEKGKIVIAHRGASGYLPEHSMAAKAMAHAMDADYIEQDLVMTRDNRLVVLHDRYLDRVTNVAEVYSGRNRKDGRYYVIDFTLEEILKLKMTEGFRVKDGKQNVIFPKRFPLWKSSFRVHTFEEEIELIQGLNKSRGKNVGIYPEIKSPWFHREEGKDISKETLRILKKYGYTTKKDQVYLQCFDPTETQRIHDELFPEFQIKVKLVQLIFPPAMRQRMRKTGAKMAPYTTDWMVKPGGMEKIASYADGIGPFLGMLVKMKSKKDNLMLTGLTKKAHQAGLVVHPFTFRADSRMPPFASNLEDLFRIFYHEVGVDGVFTDFPDRAAAFLRKK